jgi:hypothetical protein
MSTPREGRRKQRGSIDELPRGALRVRVYAGADPISGKRQDLVEVIPPGPKAAAQAEAALTRFLNQVDEQRHPRTSATVNQLLDRLPVRRAAPLPDPLLRLGACRPPDPASARL